MLSITAIENAFSDVKGDTEYAHARYHFSLIALGVKSTVTTGIMSATEHASRMAPMNIKNTRPAIDLFCFASRSFMSFLIIFISVYVFLLFFKISPVFHQVRKNLTKWNPMVRTRLDKTSPSAPHTSPNGYFSQNRTVPEWLFYNIGADLTKLDELVAVKCRVLEVQVRGCFLHLLFYGKDELVDLVEIHALRFHLPVVFRFGNFL